MIQCVRKTVYRNQHGIQKLGLKLIILTKIAQRTHLRRNGANEFVISQGKHNCIKRWENTAIIKSNQDDTMC